MKRRQFMFAMAGGVAAVTSGQPVSSQSVARKARLKQAVTRGVFARNMSLDDCCREAARLGM